MDVDPLAWAVHRHVVDAALDDLDAPPVCVLSDPDWLEPEWGEPGWVGFVVAHPYGSLTG